MNPSDMEARREALKSIIQVASSLSQALEASGILPTRSHISLDAIPPLALHFPSDLLLPITSLKIPNTLRQKIIRRFEQLFGDLKAQYISAYRRACVVAIRDASVQADFDTLQRVYQSIHTNQSIPMIRARVTSVVAEVSNYEKAALASSHTKQTFNSDYTPFLEEYFLYNAYPSALHRAILAKNSKMASRQIEVWFQNHRSRAKKEGKGLPRVDNDFPLKRALRILEDNMSILENRLFTPPAEEQKVIQEDKSTSFENRVSIRTVLPPLSTLSPNLLDDTVKIRPLHAYPSTGASPYPDPFPTTDGIFKFPPPIWRRKPATTPVVSTMIDMDEFGRMFHLKLNLSDNTRRRGTTPSTGAENKPYRPWFTSTTTFTLPAPLPSLVRKQPQPQPLSASLLETSFVRPTFGFSSLSLSSPSVPASSDILPTRKIKPLPRRIPTNSRSNSNSFASRSSSSSSVISSDSRISSSSSNYASSPEPSTPLPLPNSDLPVFTEDGQNRNLFDFAPTQLQPEYSGSNKLASSLIFDHIFPDFGHNLGEILF